jgi:ketosteroid isomerase-like protein
MKKIMLFLLCGAFLIACDNKKDKSASTGTTTTTTTTTDNTAKTAVDLPYTASYSSSFTADVSDADLKLVLMSYKDWADGNMSNVSKEYGDSLMWDKPSGEHLNLPNADIMKLWGTYRDSLSSIAIDMQAWQKMYAADKKEAYIVTWYKETDTYKGGKADSAFYHDINQVKNGKITALEQYKRPALANK